MTSSPPLNALRVFETVVRLGSFRAAADELCVTQSAVSHQIRALEDWFGAPLFDRDHNRPRPLPHAEELAASLSLSLAAVSAACRWARDFRISQPLVIAAIPSVAVCWLIPRLARFRAAYPGIDLRIVYAVHGHRIDFQDVHFAFVFARGSPHQQGVEATWLLPGESVPVCSPRMAARLGNAPTPAAIVSLDLLHDTDLSGWDAWFGRAGLGGRTVPPGTVFEDFNLLRAAALSGQGVALCPEAMIRPDLDAGHLVGLSDTRVLEDYGYHMLAGARVDSAGTDARAFRDWVLAERDA